MPFNQTYNVSTNPFPTEHPTVVNPDGSVSNVKTITMESEGKHYVIPSMVGGKQLSGEEAWSVAVEQGLEKYPAFDTADEALEASIQLHDKQAPPDKSNWREKVNQSVSDFFNNLFGEDTAHTAIDEEIKNAEYPSIAKFIYKHMDVSPSPFEKGYQKTYVPGEAELGARLFGIEDEVDPYMYMQTQSIEPEGFSPENLSAKPKQGEIPSFLDWKTFEEVPWEDLGLKGKSYKPEESPLKEVSTNVFEVNQDTEFGQNLQGRVDWGFASAKAQNSYKRNPDENYREMLFWKDPLLGDVYYEDDGSFKDVWNISMDEGETIFNEYLLPSPVNIARTLGASTFEKNVPTVRGKAKDRSIKDVMGLDY